VTAAAAAAATTTTTTKTTTIEGHYRDYIGSFFSEITRQTYGLPFERAQTAG